MDNFTTGTALGQGSVNFLLSEESNQFLETVKRGLVVGGCVH